MKTRNRSVAKSKFIHEYGVKLRVEVLALVADANARVLPERRTTAAAAIRVANRSLAKTTSYEPRTRVFIALREVSQFISLCSSNTQTAQSMRHCDLLPVAHPASTKSHKMNSASLRHARARWLAADPFVSDDYRSLVASAHSAFPGSSERVHAFTRLSVAPAGAVPTYLRLDTAPAPEIQSIIAVGGFGIGGNSRAARSLRARMQRRDRYGRFAFMGGGFSFNLDLDGSIFSVSGRVVGASGDDDIEIEITDSPNLPGGIYALPSSKGVSSKAIISREALRKIPEVELDRVTGGRESLVREGEIGRLDAPTGWSRVDSGDAGFEQFVSDDGYFVRKNLETGDYSLHRADLTDNSIGEKVADGKSWADIQSAAKEDSPDYEKVLQKAADAEAAELRFPSGEKMFDDSREAYEAWKNQIGAGPRDMTYEEWRKWTNDPNRFRGPERDGFPKDIFPDADKDISRFVEERRKEEERKKKEAERAERDARKAIEKFLEEERRDLFPPVKPVKPRPKRDDKKAKELEQMTDEELMAELAKHGKRAERPFDRGYSLFADESKYSASSIIAELQSRGYEVAKSGPRKPKYFGDYAAGDEGYTVYRPGQAGMFFPELDPDKPAAETPSRDSQIADVMDRVIDYDKSKGDETGRPGTNLKKVDRQPLERDDVERGTATIVQGPNGYGVITESDEDGFNITYTHDENGVRLSSPDTQRVSWEDFDKSSPEDVDSLSQISFYYGDDDTEDFYGELEDIVEGKTPEGPVPVSSSEYREGSISAEYEGELAEVFLEEPSPGNYIVTAIVRAPEDAEEDVEVAFRADSSDPSVTDFAAEIRDNFGQDVLDFFKPDEGGPTPPTGDDDEGDIFEDVTPKVSVEDYSSGIVDITDTSFFGIRSALEDAMDAGGSVRFMYNGKEREFIPSRIYSNPKNGLTNVVGFMEVDGEMQERTFSIDKISPMPSESKTPSGISPELEEEFDSMFETPDGAYKVDIYSMYEPRGRTDETSEDYTDDPTELSTRFSQLELAMALREAIMPTEDGEPAEGLGNLEFSDGDETVPAEALYEAIQMLGVDADVIMAGIYDTGFDDPDRVTNVDRVQEFKGDMFDSPEYSPARSEIPQTQGEADRIAQKTKYTEAQSLKSARARRAVDLMRSHDETNPKIKEIADQIIFGRSDDPILSFDEAFERFYPLSTSDDPAEREAFRAFWGVIMSIDGGDGGDLANPDVLSPSDSRARMVGIIGESLEKAGVEGDISAQAEDAYYEMLETYGQYTDYIIGKQAISSGSDDLSADTTAAAFYRMISTAASPNDRPLYRVINMHEDDPELQTLLTEGSTFAVDARPFTSADITDGSAASGLFFPPGAGQRKIIIEAMPTEIDSVNVSDVSFVPDENEWIGFGDLQVVSVREQSTPFGVETVVQVRRADATPEAPEAPAAATAYDPDADDIETWSRTGGQAGSNPGGFYETPDGRRYYVKSPRSQSHAENEVLASVFYEMLGVPAARVRLGREDGDTRIVSTLIEDADTGDFEFRVDNGDTDYLDKVRQGFVADAWLANWDSVGLVYDNIVTDGNGNPVRLDPGGSLMYRARGAEKGSAFGNNVTELDTLRDPDLNPQAASVFGDIDDATLQAAARQLRDITPSQIDATVDSIVSDPDDAALLKERLKARRQSILDRFGVQEGQDDPDLFQDPEPLTDAMGYQAQDLVPGDVTATDSFVVEKVFRDDETPKGKVSVQGYYPGHESQRKEWNEDTEIEVSRGGTTPPKGTKPALHRPKRPYAPRNQETFTGDMRDLLEGAESWEEVADIIRSTEIVYFDYETTGIGDGELNRPVQIGAVRVVNGEVVERFNMYMNPEFRLSDWSRENLKREDGELVTDEWLATQPSMREVHEQFIAFVGNRPILGGQNVPFDTEVLNRTLQEQGLELEIGGTIDSLPMARGTLPKWSSGSPDGPSQVGRDGKRRSSNSLGPVAEYLDVELGNWHRADADAEAAWDITDAMLSRAAMPDADVSTESFDGREAEKIAQDRAEYDAAMSVYKDELAEYEAAKAVAAAWNCGGAGITAAVGPGEGPCDVPDPDDMINNATPDESMVDPEGVPGGATDSNVSMADALDDGAIERPEMDGVDVKDPYAGEKFPPTDQQRDVVDAVLTGENVVVRALAGTGKTSTLKLIARRLKKEQPNKNIVYVAFNKSIQLEADATMPNNVESRTGDSIAWRAIGSGLTDKRKRNRFNNKPSKLANDLGITGQPNPDNNEDSMSATQVYRAINKAVTNYTISADDEIGPQHFEFDNVPDEWLDKAREIWADLRSPDGVLPFNNNHATKIWALSRPDLSKSGSGLDRKADVIFFDEAQDINPVIGKVIADQTAQVVYVGDGNQAIYGFRGAEDELQKISAPNDLPLTKSWRFGPQIAGIGNRFLAALGSDYRIEGGGPDGEILPRGGMPDADAVLVRSNAGAVREIYKELDAGRKVGVTKSFKEDLDRFVRHADWLKSGADPSNRPQMHEDLAPFSSWDEVVKSLDDEDNKKLEFLVDLVDSEGVDGLYDMLGRLIPYTTNADVASDDPVSIQPLTPSDVTSGSAGEIANGVMFEVSGDRVKISGKTFDVKESIKSLGFKWNSADKSWVRSIKGDDNRARTLNELRSNLSGGGAAEKPDVVVSTAHRAKGLEWDRVRIGDDFRGPRIDPDTGEEIPPSPEELRLAYVAVTRAQKQLDPGSLDYIYGMTVDADESSQLPGAPEAPEVEAPEAPSVPMDIDPELRASEVAKYDLEDLGDGELDAVGSENSYIREMYSDTWEGWVDGQSIGTAKTREEIVDMYNERVGEVVDARLTATEEVAETRDEVAPGGTPESPEDLEGGTPLPPPSPDESPVDVSGAIIEEIAFDPKTQKTFDDDVSNATEDLEMVKDDIYSKGSTGKKFKDALQRTLDTISDYVDGKISLSEAVSRLRNEEDALDEFSTSTGKTKLDYDFAHGSIRDARRILDGSVYGPAEIGKGLPPEGSGLGFSKDGVFIKPGMRVRDKWGYAGTVVRYNESGGYVNVYILKDIDHRDPDKLGEKAKKSYGPRKYIDNKGTKTLTVIREGDDNSPWIDSGKVPEGKKPKNLDSQLDELRKMGDDDGEAPMGVEPPSPEPDDSGDAGEAPAGTTEALRENVEDNKRDEAWVGSEEDRPEGSSTSPEDASRKITEALRDSENPDYTADDETIKDLLRDEISQTTDDDRFITIAPPSGFETRILRSDAVALVGDSPKGDAPSGATDKAPENDEDYDIESVGGDTSDVDSPVNDADFDAGEFSAVERSIIEAGSEFAPGSPEDASYRNLAQRFIENKRELDNTPTANYTDLERDVTIEILVRETKQTQEHYASKTYKPLVRAYLAGATDQWLDENVKDDSHPRPTKELVVSSLRDSNPFRPGTPHAIAWERIIDEGAEVDRAYEQAGVDPRSTDRLTSDQAEKFYEWARIVIKNRVEGGRWRDFVDEADRDWVAENLNEFGELQDPKSVLPLPRTTYKGVDFTQRGDGVWVAESFIDRYDIDVDDPDTPLPLFIPMGTGGAETSGEGYFFSTEKKRFWGRYGAGGALISFVDDDGEIKYVLGKRAEWISAGGGTWGLPGGAHRNQRNSDDPQVTAIEETLEEIGVTIDPTTVPDFVHENDVTQDWRYSTVGFTVSADDAKSAKISDNETSEIKFFTADELLKMVGTGELHPSLDEFIPDLLERHRSALKTRSDAAKLSKNFDDYSNDDPFGVDEVSSTLAADYRDISEEQGIDEKVFGNTMGVVLGIRHSYPQSPAKQPKSYKDALREINDTISTARAAAVDIGYRRRPDQPGGEKKPYGGHIETQTLALISQGDIAGASLYLHTVLEQTEVSFSEPDVHQTLLRFRDSIVEGRFDDISFGDDWLASEKSVSKIGRDVVGGKGAVSAAAKTLRESVESVKRTMAGNPEAAKKVSELFSSNPAPAMRTAATRLLGPGRPLDSAPEILPITESAFDGVPSVAETINTVNAPDARSMSISTLFDGSDIEDGEVEVSRVKRRFSDRVQTQMSFKLTAWAAERLVAGARLRSRDDESRWTVDKPSHEGTSSGPGYGLYKTSVEVDDRGVRYVNESNTIRLESTGGGVSKNSRGYVDEGMEELVYRGDGFSIRVATVSDGVSYNHPYIGRFSEEGLSSPTGAYNLNADTNRVRITFDDDNPSPEVIELAMKVAGVRDPRPATKQDMDLLVENRAISVISTEGSYNNPALTSTGPSREVIVQELRNTYPGLFDYTVVTDPATGKVEIQHSEELVKALKDRAQIGDRDVFWHSGNLPYDYQDSVSGSKDLSPSESAAMIILRVLGLSDDDSAASTPGIVSTRRRFDGGVGIEGQSSFSDYGTGSAEYAYISRDEPRIVGLSPGSASASASYAFEIDPDDVIKRLDIWANSIDRFGSRSTRDPYAEMASDSAYEILVKGAISPSAIRSVRLGTRTRQAIFDSLRSRGISKVNGIELEEFFKLFDG